MAHHDPQSTGRSPYIGLPEGKYQWSRLGFPSWGSVAIDVDGTIYYESDDTLNWHSMALFAVTPEGNVKWKTKIIAVPEPGGKNHPYLLVTSTGKIIIISRDGNLYAVDRNGNQLWSFKADKAIYSKGLTIGKDGTLYFVSGSKTLYALDSNGNVLWTKFVDNGFWGSDAGPQIVFSPDGAQLYVGGMNNGLYAIDVNGNILWYYDNISNGFYDSRLVDGQGNIYARSNDTIICLTSNGDVRWKNTEVGGITGFTQDYDGNIYTIGNYTKSSGGADIRLVSLDYNGKIRWYYRTDDNFVGDLVCDREGTVYFGSSINNKIYYAIKNDGTIKWKINHGYSVDFSSSPAIASDGSIYVGSGGGGTGGDNGLFKFK